MAQLPEESTRSTETGTETNTRAKAEAQTEAAAGRDRELRALEFYSGIGGLHYGLKQYLHSSTSQGGAKGSEDHRVKNSEGTEEEHQLRVEVVDSFDINDCANDVYEWNFGRRPKQTNIQTVTARQLDAYKAQVWLLSPPCQPYTRQGLKKDCRDARASSFLSLISLLPLMQHPPSFLLLENVQGFEKSETAGMLREVLALCGLHIWECLLSPLHLAIPYSRPRYFCLARSEPFPAALLEGHFCPFHFTCSPFSSSPPSSPACSGKALPLHQNQKDLLLPLQHPPLQHPPSLPPHSLPPDTDRGELLLQVKPPSGPVTVDSVRSGTESDRSVANSDMRVAGTGVPMEEEWRRMGSSESDTCVQDARDSLSGASGDASPSVDGTHAGQRTETEKESSQMTERTERTEGIESRQRTESAERTENAERNGESAERNGDSARQCLERNDSGGNESCCPVGPQKVAQHLHPHPHTLPLSTFLDSPNHPPDDATGTLPSDQQPPVAPMSALPSDIGAEFKEEEEEEEEKEAEEEHGLGGAFERGATEEAHGAPGDGAAEEADTRCGSTSQDWESYVVPRDMCIRFGACLDVVSETSNRCCCFTKSYTRYAKGTGSLLHMQTQSPQMALGKIRSLTGQKEEPLCPFKDCFCSRPSSHRNMGPTQNPTVIPSDRGPSSQGNVDSSQIQSGSGAHWCPLSSQLRYFTPREVARLHSFPSSFSFPPHISMKQRYALLGNSVSVEVVRQLLRVLFSVQRRV